MFGLNQIIGKKYFDLAPKEHLLVTSRFYTLQGEGPFRGHPAYFIRLAKCNLACSFCDTYFDSGSWQSFTTLFEESDTVIGEFYKRRRMKVPAWADNLPRKNVVLVITGGEPSLQENLSSFLEYAGNYFTELQIESNGISVLDNLPANVTLVVSPKCSEKDNIAIKYLSPNKKMLDRANALKFVMCAPEIDQFTPYSTVPDWAHQWAHDTGKPVFVSPMNIYLNEPKKAKELRAAKQLNEISIQERSETDETISFWEKGLLDMEKNQRNHEYAAEYVMKYGFILNLQIHLFASLP